MDASRFAAWTRTIGTALARRTLLAAGLAAVGIGQVSPDAIEAKDSCKKSGKPCKKKKKGCKAKFCETGLAAPFTIEANWTNPATDHDTFLFVPNLPGNAFPSPHIDMTCTSSKAFDGTVYPFAFVSGDAIGPGNEVTTIKELVDGRYEYHLQLHGPSPADDVEVRLVQKGKVVQSWRNPASPLEDHWRVFSLTVAGKRVTLETLGDIVKQPFPLKDVCPS